MVNRYLWLVEDHRDGNYTPRYKVSSRQKPPRGNWLILESELKEYVKTALIDGALVLVEDTIAKDAAQVIKDENESDRANASDIRAAWSTFETELQNASTLAKLRTATRKLARMVKYLLKDE